MVLSLFTCNAYCYLPHTQVYHCTQRTTHCRLLAPLVVVNLQDSVFQELQIRFCRRYTRFNSISYKAINMYMAFWGFLAAL